MKVVFTDPALADLDAILAYTADNYPQLVAILEKRIRNTIARIQDFPRSARILEERPEIRVVPLLRYPYLIFYRVRNNTIEILHIHHAARNSSIE
ncbi:MAG TPA: type II toxin-antitoxin system RelE/ParE family toxin [Rhizomicrobium sp.]|jgi:toxin ParE1/3/4|nr:type II toxin-antitoxin system RelE/ParE family toxin [Rhizomicrobium sp.]